MSKLTKSQWISSEEVRRAMISVKRGALKRTCVCAAEGSFPFPQAWRGRNLCWFAHPLARPSHVLPGRSHDRSTSSAEETESTRHRLMTNRPLPIGHGQTISAPHVHALALEIARETLSRGQTTADAWILDVGSGSGYLTGAFAALLNEMKIKGHVVGIERCRALADQSRDNLRAAGLGGLLQSREI